NGEVDMTSADHAKAVRTGKEAGFWQHGNGLLAGIDEVSVFLALIGKWAHAEHAILALQAHIHAFGDVIGHKRRNADAEIDVKAVLQLARRAGGHLIAGPGHYAFSSMRGRTVRCSICLVGAGT